MKLLVIGDPHGKLPPKLKSIVKKEKPEVIVVTGEIPPVPMEKFAPRELEKHGYRYADTAYQKLLKELCSFKLPVIVMRGNSYPVAAHDRWVSTWFRKHKNLYYKRTGKITLLGQDFVLFDHIWEAWAYKWQKRVWAHARHSRSKERIMKFERYMKKARDPILVSHAPPYGFLDKVPGVGSVGSKVVLRMIKKFQPKLVLCGHIHEGKGKAHIGKSSVINAGARGDYYIVRA